MTGTNAIDVWAWFDHAVNFAFIATAMLLLRSRIRRVLDRVLALDDTPSTDRPPL
ncbi:hypothetical protein LV457_02670 [Mycobacterium sp. MYCO198283]|uniref:hypothetical protein n=1 Tax=Mycobacterium sp. MYCO198283 TaxID=2883505 RepID=UPI001E5912D7|nr:hypothetical protein [Mycobacterium sp. MYCO198283]MCG5431193.1 hypothetical protein [Mycobacterium sp. MYCO198283]